MYTGHRRTFAKVSNGILIGLSDHGKTWVTKYKNLSGVKLDRNSVWTEILSGFFFANSYFLNLFKYI